MEQMRVIPTKVHGMIDFLVAIVLLLAPNLFGFAELDGPAVWIPRVLGAAILVIGILTRHELGLIKLIPMPVHLFIDIASSIFLAASPFIFGFADNPANVWLPHVVAGIGYLVISLMTETEPRGMSDQTRTI